MNFFLFLFLFFSFFYLNNFIISLCLFKSSYPKQYITYYNSSILIIDGYLNESDWLNIPYSSLFEDINTTIIPKYITKFKILWDNNYLYIGGYIQEEDIWSNITNTCHCIDNDNDQVIYHDNDFEVFIDPDSNNHYYKEFEMNSYNSTWDLLLNKPYSDGGYENSTRVYGNEGFDMQPPLICSVYVNGTINNPEGLKDNYWTVEIAIPLEKLAYMENITLPPNNNTFWRINFSRVEWNTIIQNNTYIKQPSCQSCPIPGTEAEDNWVWSPQGEINMHAPDKWGMLQFVNLPSNKYSSSSYITNPEWPIRSLAMILYYAQRDYYSVNGYYTSNINELDKYTKNYIFSTMECSFLPEITLQNNNQEYIAKITDIEMKYTATIQYDRLLTVFKN